MEIVWRLFQTFTKTQNFYSHDTRTKQSISNSFARSVLFLQLANIEFKAYKGQYPIPQLNNILGKGINGLNGTLNDLKRIGINAERIDEHFDENRLMAMSSIIQFLTNCTTEQLETIESEFEQSKLEQI